MVDCDREKSFWERLGRPKYIAAPMVAQSELPFRLLVRLHGVHLAYTPMLHSRLFVQDKKYRISQFSTCPLDRPLIAQFCGHDPEILAQTACLVAEDVDAIDLNFGCPQGIAKRGYYGAYLLEEPDLIENIVQIVVKSSPIPVTCKLRKVSNNPQDTLNLARRIEAAGCSALCLHGRTLHEKGQYTAQADWASIQAVKRALHIPVIANGGISSLDEAKQCLFETGADAVMSAEALLENPALFQDHPIHREKLAKEYLNLVHQYPVSPSIVKAHLFRFLFAQLQENVDLRSRLGHAKTLAEFELILELLKNRKSKKLIDQPLCWYFRHRMSESLCSSDALQPT